MRTGERPLNGAGSPAQVRQTSGDEMGFEIPAFLRRQSS